MRDEKSELECEELARRAKGGDREARNSLYEACRPDIDRLAWEARRLLRRLPPGVGGITQEDVEQQGFVAFCDLLDRWNPARTPFMPYLVINMRWKLSHYARAELRHHEQRQRPLVEPVSPDAEPLGEPASKDAGPAILRLESKITFDQETAALKDERLKRVITLRYAEGLTKEEIAALEGISPRTVNRELRQARAALRSLLNDEAECG